MNGLILVDKPVGVTSFDCIRQLRRITGIRKIGHAGTLDPLASGLMLILIGSACKQAMTLTKLNKSYVATLKLGYISSTGDEEGAKTAISPIHPDEPALKRALHDFVGDVEQTPPIYSAIKIAGQEAYKRARRGETVAMPTRRVTISTINLLKFEYPFVTIKTDVSSGTYIRTLAEDIGAKLGTGAYLSALIRTRVGDYDLEQAQPLHEITLASAEAAMIDPSGGAE